MAKQEFEFTLIFSGVRELTVEVLDAFYAGGCDDALIGMRGGVAYADFCREADSFRQAVFSAMRDVELAGVGAKVEHIEPDEMVTMSEIARRLNITREGVRKRVAGTRGPGNFPPPTGGVTRQSPLWRWTDVIQWHQENQKAKQPQEHLGVSMDANALMNLGSNIAVLNAALDMRRRVSLEEAMEVLQSIVVQDATVRPNKVAAPKILAEAPVASGQRKKGAGKRGRGRAQAAHVSEER